MMSTGFTTDGAFTGASKFVPTPVPGPDKPITHYRGWGEPGLTTDEYTEAFKAVLQDPANVYFGMIGHGNDSCIFLRGSYYYNKNEVFGIDEHQVDVWMREREPYRLVILNTCHSADGNLASAFTKGLGKNTAALVCTDKTMTHRTTERIMRFLELVDDPANAERTLHDILDVARGDIEPDWSSCYDDPYFFGDREMKPGDIFKEYDGLVWEFPHGLNQNPTAEFSRIYDGKTTLISELSPPPELIMVRRYDEAEMEWEWYRQGWPESTLLELKEGEIYGIVVRDACVWTT